VGGAAEESAAEATTEADPSSAAGIDGVGVHQPPGAAVCGSTDGSAPVGDGPVARDEGVDQEGEDDEADEENDEDEGGEASTAEGKKIRQADDRPHLNIVFIGHVDAGKSTTCGNILYLSGQVDQRTIEKYEKEAKDKNRESWFLAFIMDINEEERAKGKTVEVGRAKFETDNRRFTILDAPGHKSFVPNMIAGAAQADVGVLIISARRGEFETGFERGGQTREHAMLAKTLGVTQLIVAINKMDDPTCDWDENRYTDIEKKLTPYLRQFFNPAKDIFFIPISGLTGSNLKHHVSDASNPKSYHAKGSWYGRDKPTLWELFDGLVPPDRRVDDPLRIPLLSGYKDQGVMAMGKVEAGVVKANAHCLLMPNKNRVKILSVFVDEDEVDIARPGENVALKVSGVEEDQICKGYVLCTAKHPCPVISTFKATVNIVELPEHPPIITAGYSCVFHAHTACEEVQILQLLESTDRATKKKKTNPQFIKSSCMVKCRMQLVSPMCLEPYAIRPQLGRFTLRDGAKTIAVGKVDEIEEAD